ncbi:hypothetical protein RintRC_5053 [Richelia intracellularis]|nr:hypothetical protein RintRC_5053 [Richelia intracellularis]
MILKMNICFITSIGMINLKRCDSFGSTEYYIINDKSTRVVLTGKNVLDGIRL